MSLVWRKIQRSNKKAAKYRFTIIPQELLIIGTNKWTPENVLVACLHRRRRVESKVRKWERGISDPCRGLIVWPEQTSDPLLFETTLYGNNVTRVYDDKEWILMVEELTRKGKHLPIGAVNLNMRLFIENSPGTGAELKLKLRPLWAEVVHCSIQILIYCSLVDEGEANDVDIASDTSSVHSCRKESINREIPDHEINCANDSAIASISLIPCDIEILKDVAVSNNMKNECGNESFNLRPIKAVNSTTKYLKSGETNNESHKKDELKVLASSTSTRLEQEANELQNLHQIFAKTEPVTNMIDEADTKISKTHDEIIKLRPVYNQLPEVVENEDILAWCQRITNGYTSVKITDFTKSFRSGLAFCALIHRYKPDLIGDFNKLDFSDLLCARRDNCRKAFEAAYAIGVQKKLDAGIIATLPDRQDVLIFLSQLRSLLEGVSPADTKLKDSDHRVSALFALSESEASVMRELENLRKQREHEEAIDLTNIPDEDRTRFEAVINNFNDQRIVKMADKQKSESKNFANPFNSDSEEEITSKTGSQRGRAYIPVPSINQPQTSDNYNNSLTAISSIVANRHEELLNKRRQMVDHLKTVGETDIERSLRLREEARRLMGNAVLDGSTIVISASAPSTTHQSPAEVVTPSTKFHQFKKIQPSSTSSRNKYGPQHTSSLERHSKSLSNSKVDIEDDSTQTTLDRMKRYGSMRGQELAETVARMAGRTFPSIALKVSEPTVEMTPTRKIISQWEKDASDRSKIQEEQSRLANRLLEVSAEDEKICCRLKKTEASSEEEECLLKEHMRLLNEKDSLVRKSEYFNVLEQLHDVNDNIAELQRQLGSVSVHEQDNRTEEDKQKTDAMMEELVGLVNKKDQLSQKLINHEAEDEEMGERDRLTLEAAAKFSRGFEQPISASKRLITWIRSEIHS